MLFGTVLRTKIVRVFPAVALLAALSLPAPAEQITFFRIGTGSTGGTYFPIGGLLATAVSHPPGSRPCEAGGSCGVPNLIAVAQSTQGSVDNIAAIAEGQLESGLSQADVAYWAYNGTEIYEPAGPHETLRAIANLFPESIHVVVRRDAGIQSIADLRGKRVSVGEKASGTLVDTTIILNAYDLDLEDIEPAYLRPGVSADKLLAGELDAIFFVAGAPATAIADLARDGEVMLLSIDGERARAVIEAYPFFAPGMIEAGTYRSVGATRTLTVGAQWIVSATVDYELVYQLTRALWHENTRKVLESGHEKGASIRLRTALDGIAIPLHPGAERYYREVGLIGGDEPADTDTSEGVKTRTGQ